MNYDALHNLEVREYEHPGEKNAVTVLRGVSGGDVSKWLDMMIQFEEHADIAGNRFRITEKTNPRVYRLYQTALARLDMPGEYPLYSQMQYAYGTDTIGVNDPVIVINSSNIGDFSDEAILYCLGHELGRIKSGHQLYYKLADLMSSATQKIGTLGEAAFASMAYALLEWERYAKYTDDRAGLIACGGIDGCVEAGMRNLGYSDKLRGIDFSREKILRQVEDFEIHSGSMVGKFFYGHSIARTSYPWQMLRLKALLQWHDSGAFETLVKAHM